MTEHEHVFGTVVASYTAPGEDSLTWEACRSCGAENPGHPKPEGAQDEPPETDENAITEPEGVSDEVVAKLGNKTSKEGS